MKTITYNPETHVLVPIEPGMDITEPGWEAVDWEDIRSPSQLYLVWKAMLAAAPQPEPNHNWCVGCSPDNCSSCGAAPVAYIFKPNNELLWPHEVDQNVFASDQEDYDKLYTMPQPDRVAELEAETTKLKLDLLTSYGEAEELSGKVAGLEVALDELDELARKERESTAQAIRQANEIATLKSALKVARDGIDKFLVANDPTEFGCACDLSVGYLCGPCRADMQQEPLKIALAKINEVLK